MSVYEIVFSPTGGTKRVSEIFLLRTGRILYRISRTAVSWEHRRIPGKDGSRADEAPL